MQSTIQRFAKENNLSREEVIYTLGSTHLLYISEKGRCMIVSKDDTV